MARIGIMGGTFNPIHVGHLMLAEYALEEKQLDEVWLIPTGYSYMKDSSQILPGEERLKMVEMAIEDGKNARLKCRDTEIKRKGYTYSYETLEILKEEYPKHQFFFIFGADCLFSIENWKYPQKIFDSCEIIVAIRGDSDIRKIEEQKARLSLKYHGTIHVLPFLKLEISSTLIRERINSGKSIRYMVPEKVRKYIEEKDFYRGEKR